MVAGAGFVRQLDAALRSLREAQLKPKEWTDARAAVAACEETKQGPERYLKVTLKYVDGKVPVVSGLKRISKPGLRVYAGKTEIPRVLGGMGIAILSTSKGILSDKDARRQKTGGELLCYIW